LKKSCLVSGTVALLGATALVGVSGITPANAVSPANTVSVDSNGGGGSVSGTCAFLTSLPQTGGIDTIPVLFTGSATATGLAVSTSIACSLTNGGSGGGGITLPGAEAAIAGKGQYARLAPNPQICATVSAAFSDGSTAPSKTSCHSL
jgi:hypothetical protein